MSPWSCGTARRVPEDAKVRDWPGVQLAGEISQYQLLEHLESHYPSLKSLHGLAGVELPELRSLLRCRTAADRGVPRALYHHIPTVGAQQLFALPQVLLKWAAFWQRRPCAVTCIAFSMFQSKA
eukprot:1859570-Amphidinium_carterae.1